MAAAAIDADKRLQLDCAAGLEHDDDQRPDLDAGWCVELVAERSDSDATSNLTTAAVQAMSTDQLTPHGHSALQRRLRTTKRCQLVELSTSQVSALTTTLAGAFTSTQGKELTSTQVPYLSTAVLGAMTAAVDWRLGRGYGRDAMLCTTQLNALSRQPLNQLSTTQVTNLSTTQLQALSTDQLNDLSTKPDGHARQFVQRSALRAGDGAGRRYVNHAVGNGLTSTEIGYMTPDQVNAFSTTWLRQPHWRHRRPRSAAIRSALCRQRTSPISAPLLWEGSAARAGGYHRLGYSRAQTNNASGYTAQANALAAAVRVSLNADAQNALISILA